MGLLGLGGGPTAAGGEPPGSKGLPPLPGTCGGGGSTAAPGGWHSSPVGARCRASGPTGARSGGSAAAHEQARRWVSAPAGLPGLTGEGHHHAWGPAPVPRGPPGLAGGGVSCLCARGPTTGCWWQFAAVTGDPPEGPGWWGLPWCTPACPGWPAGGSAMVRCRPLGTGRLGRGLLRCSGTHRELPARGVLYNPQWPSWGCHPGGNTQVPSSLS